MLDWILHRPPHLSNQAEIQMAEFLRGLADSPCPFFRKMKVRVPNQRATSIFTSRFNLYLQV